VIAPKKGNDEATSIVRGVDGINALRAEKVEMMCRSIVIDASKVATADGSRRLAILLWALTVLVNYGRSKDLSVPPLERRASIPLGGIMALRL